MQHVPMTKVVQIRKHLERGEEPEDIAKAYKIPVERVLGFAPKPKKEVRGAPGKAGRKTTAKKTPVKKATVKTELEKDAEKEGTVAEVSASDENWEE